MSLSTIERVTAESLAMLKSAVAKSNAGVTTANAGAAIDLAQLVSLIPVVTPMYNMTPRVTPPMGSNATLFETNINMTSSQTFQFSVTNSAGPLVQQSVIQQTTSYGVSAFRNVVTLDAIAQNQGYYDPYALGVLTTLGYKLVLEDILMLTGITYSIGDAATPTATTSATGGTIAASTAVDVKVAYRSWYNWYAGGSTAASAQASITTGSTTGTNSVTASVSPPLLTAAFDWFVNGFYYTTTQVPTVTITSIPTANQPVPNSPSLPLLYQAGNVAITSVPATDTSYSTAGYSGLLASIGANISSQTGSGITYVTPGTGVSQGNYTLNLAGGQLTSSGPQITQINEALNVLWANWQISPSMMFVSSQQMNDISTTILASTNAVNYTPGNSVAARRGFVMGGATPVYVSPITGAEINVVVHPHLPPGVIAMAPSAVPYPASNIGAPWEMRTTYDNFLFAYGASDAAESVAGANGPRWPFSISSNAAFVNYAAPLMVLMTNIAPGIA